MLSNIYTISLFYILTIKGRGTACAHLCLNIHMPQCALSLCCLRGTLKETYDIKITKTVKHTTMLQNNFKASGKTQNTYTAKYTVCMY